MLRIIYYCGGSNQSNQTMNKYLKGIKESNNAIMREIYQKNFPILKKFILENNGDEEEAKDIFQDVLVALFRRLEKEDIEIKTTFGTYVFNMGKYMWFKRLKTKKTNTKLVGTPQGGEDPDIATEQLRIKIYEEELNNLGSDCQKVLKLHFEKINYKEIAQRMGYTGEEYARRKRYLCVNSLKAAVKKHPLYKELRVA